MFTGSVLDNIDPNRELSNEEYKHILSTSGLMEIHMKKQLVMFNNKEKRFLVMARALARPSKVVIIEGNCEEFGEDVERSVIEKIRNEFQDSTIIFISEKDAHIINGIKTVIY